MKKKILIIAGIIIVFVLGIGIYKIIEKNVTDRETYDFEIDENGSNVTEDHTKHSFYGKVIEVTSSYLIVEPNADEEERKVTDKFRIKLANNDVTYEVGTNVKITYEGLIQESDLAQIRTTKIEIISAVQFEIIFTQESGNVKSQIIDKNTSKQYDYNVYICNGKVDIVINKKTYSLEDALRENKITMEEIIAKANNDIANPAVANDGGSIEFHYKNYTIIKLHKINGNRDVYIGDKNLTLDDLNI